MSNSVFEECQRLEFPPIVSGRFGFEECHKNSQPNGQVGRTHCPWCRADILKLQTSWGITLKGLDELDDLVGHVHRLENQSTTSPGLTGRAGSTKQQSVWNGGTATTPLFFRMTALEKAMVRSQTCPCSPLSRVESPLFRVSLSHFLCPSAGVAFQMINLAITAQHARGEGCWEGGDFHSRGQQQEFAEKPEDAWRPTCLCGTWTSELRMLRTTVVWRLSMDSHCLVESNWQWTRHLC